jgi:predicted aminopeptidase
LLPTDPSRPKPNRLFLNLVPVLCLSLGGCAGPGYYYQAAKGHLQIIRSAEDIDVLLTRGEAEPELANRLEQARSIRDFAATELMLPADGSYGTYATTGREAVSWNVLATPEFSLQAKRWCFPVSGCVPYRGYFQQEDAEAFAGRLRRKGYDVGVSPAVAYSTLGWFDDPVLDTMLLYDDSTLAAIIFHELAHRRLYVRGDAAFSEAYASFVEEVGVERWLTRQGQTDRLAAWREKERLAGQLARLRVDARSRLEAAYAQDRSDEWKRTRKHEIFHALEADLRMLFEARGNNQDPVPAWVDRELNNADLALAQTYRGGLCAFRSLYRAVEGEMAQFHAKAREKARLDSDERRAWLNRPCRAVAPDHDL